MAGVASTCRPSGHNNIRQCRSVRSCDTTAETSSWTTCLMRRGGGVGLYWQGAGRLSICVSASVAGLHIPSGTACLGRSAVLLVNSLHFCSNIDNVGIAGLHMSSAQRAKALTIGCAARSHSTCQHLSQAIFSGNVA